MSRQAFQSANCMGCSTRVACSCLRVASATTVFSCSLKICMTMQAVFSACPLHTGVVTVIDKDTDWECYCP